MRRMPTDYELIFVTKGVLEMQIGASRFPVIGRGSPMPVTCCYTVVCA